MQETKKRSGINWSLLKKLAIAAGVLILAFLLGYVPSMISSRATEQKNPQAESAASLVPAPTLSEYSDRWLKDITPNIASGTLKSYTSALALHIRPTLGAVAR